MSDEEKECPQGWDQKQLFAYVERDMENNAREALEAHLKSCEICASEVESLQKMDVLLKHHPEVFHPDEQQLYRYVTASGDPDGEIARHLEACENCREDVQILKEMIDAHSAVLTEIPAIPQKLLRRIEQLRPPAAADSILERLFSTIAGLISAPFRMPKLALGTAAAIVVLAIISIPLWQALKDVPRPDLGVTIQEPESPKPSETVPLEADQLPETLKERGKLEDSERLRSDPYGKSGVPQEPEPAAKPPADAKFEKFDDREAGRISPTPGAAPPQLPPSPQVMLERSHRPAVGMAPPPEKEVSARPRAPKAPMPASPMKRGAAKPQYPTAAQEARPESKGPPASFYDSRIPVRIRIVDSEGRSLAEFKFQFPADLTSRYSFQEDTENGAGDLILIRVVKRDGFFDLSANLFEPNSTRSSRTLQASGVPEPDLQNRITSLISALLEKK